MAAFLFARAENNGQTVILAADKAENLPLCIYFFLLMA